jgi:hypothetical protein
VKNNIVLIQRPFNDYQKTRGFEIQDDCFWKHQLSIGTRRVNKEFCAEFIAPIFITHTIIDIYVTTISVNLFYSMKCSRADGRVGKFRFPNVSGTNFFTKFRVCWWFRAKLDA